MDRQLDLRSEGKEWSALGESESYTCKRFRLLATAADIGGSVIQPSPRCIVTPSGDRETRPRIDIRTRTFRRCWARPSVTHLCSVGRGAQDDQTHRQNRAHSISSNPATAPYLMLRLFPHNLYRLHNCEKRRKRASYFVSWVETI